MTKKVFAVQMLVLWIAGWRVHYYVYKPFSRPKLHTEEFNKEFKTKEEASEFLARCRDCPTDGKFPKDKLCCDHKTLNELHN